MENVYRLRMEGIKKSFGGVRALNSVDFSVKPGEIHALVGENGAGKSTLMKILSGAYQKDEGTILIDGAPVEIASPRRGKELGVGIVYQEFELAGDLTVAENIFLDRLGSGGLIDWKQIYEKADAIVKSLNFEIDVKSVVRDLSVAYQQVVEIAKVLSQNAKILVLDEPTAVLSPKETEALFETLYKLRKEGVSIIYISHRMEEIFRIADSITIMRDGEVTGTGLRSEMEMDQVIERMIGRKLSAMFPPRSVKIGEEILRVEELEGRVFHGISFRVRRGEILGIAGLVGSGRSDIVRAVFGADKKKSGKIYLNGREVTIRSPKDAVRLGIGLIPENRKEQGLVLDFSVKKNITMPNIRSVRGAFGVIRQRKENALAKSLVEKLTVKTDSINAAANELSGGNQQKVVLAKWFNTDSQVIIFDEPTRGVDVGAKIEIYSLINEFAERNLGVIIISSELSEIIGMCDRTIVIDNGRKKGELEKGELSELNIMKLAVGGDGK